MNIYILKYQLNKLCEEISLLAHQYPLKIVTAESCTAGLICASLTNLPGSSKYIEGGFIAYSNDMKHSMLNISTKIIDEFGAVSEQVAKEMVNGALKNSQNANCAIAVTGIAGPDGGTTNKPVGLVWIGYRHKNHPLITQKNIFYGNRENIRIQTAINALELIKKNIKNRILQ